MACFGGYTRLHWSAMKSDVNHLVDALDNGASLLRKTEEGFTPLDLAKQTSPEGGRIL